MLHDMMTNQYFYYGIIAAGTSRPARNVPHRPVLPHNSAGFETGAQSKG